MKINLKRSTDLPWGIYIAIFLLIYSSKDSCFFGVNKDSNIKFVGYAITFLAVIYLLSKSGIKNVFDLGGRFIIGLSALSILTLIVSTDVPIKYMYEIMLFLACSAIVSLVPFQEFKVLYTDILFVLATCSLVFHVLNIIYPSLLDVFPIHYNEGGYPFRFCILSVTTTPEFSLIRNWGIFREPGVYIFYLNLGLVFELFSDRINFKKVICFLIAIVTTLSTAGFIVAAGVISSFLIFSKHANRKQRWTFFTIILIGTIYVVTSGYFDSIYGMVFGKLFYENDSTASRTGSFVTNINMWLQNFGTIILGQGYTFVENEFSKYQSLAIGGENNTNTVFKMLAVHGIVYTSIIYGLTYRFCAKNYGHLGYLILLFILMLQSNEDLTVSFHTYLLAFYALEKSRFLVKNV